MTIYDIGDQTRVNHITVSALNLVLFIWLLLKKNFFFLNLGHDWRCLGLTPNFLVRYHFWQCSGDHLWYGELDQV